MILDFLYEMIMDLFFIEKVKVAYEIFTHCCLIKPKSCTETKSLIEFEDKF